MPLLEQWVRRWKWPRMKDAFPLGGGRHGPRQNQMIADPSRSCDETNRPATKHFSCHDDKIPKPAPRIALGQRRATPALHWGAASAAGSSEQGGHSMSFRRSDDACLQDADRDRLCAGRAGNGRECLYRRAAADVHRRCDAAVRVRDSRCRSHHRLHGAEARPAQRRLQQAVFQYVPPAATPANYAPSTKPGKPVNLNPHKRG